MIKLIESTTYRAFIIVEDENDYREALHECCPVMRHNYDGPGMYIHYDDVLRIADRTELEAYKEKYLTLVEFINEYLQG